MESTRQFQSVAEAEELTSIAARQGVRIQNLSETDPLVLLKHFGPGNPDAEPLVRNGSKS